LKSYLVFIAVFLFTGCSFAGKDRVDKMKINCEQCEVSYEKDRVIVDDILIMKGF